MPRIAEDGRKTSREKPGTLPIFRDYSSKNLNNKIKGYTGLTEC
jgi:hypothetical protein